MIQVYDMSSGERLDGVPGEAEFESPYPERERPMPERMEKPMVAPALREIELEAPVAQPLPLTAGQMARLFDAVD